MQWVGSSRWWGFARWGGWELGLLSTTQKGVWIYCSFQLYQLTKKFHFDIKENNLQVRWDQALEKISERDSGISILGDTQNLTRHGPEKPDLTLKLALTLKLPLLWPKCWTRWLSEVPTSLDYFMTLSPEAACLGRAELCCSQKGTALVQHVPALPTLGHCPMLGSHVFLAKCGWEEQMSAEPGHPSATPGIWSALWYSHYYLAPCATENWMWRVNAFEFITGTLIFLFESTLTVSFKTSDKNSSVWKPAGV